MEWICYMKLESALHLILTSIALEQYWLNTIVYFHFISYILYEIYSIWSAFTDGQPHTNTHKHTHTHTHTPVPYAYCIIMYNCIHVYRCTFYNRAEKTKSGYCLDQWMLFCQFCHCLFQLYIVLGLSWSVDIIIILWQYIIIIYF